MKNLKYLAIAILGMLMISCGGDKPAEVSSTEATTETIVEETPNVEVSKDGIGKFTSENFPGGDFDAALAAKGKEIAELKCTVCHNLDDSRKTGPGWKGVTDRRTAAWIMNFMLDPQPMIDNDPVAKAMFEEYLTPMPNQNLTEDDAKALYMYMRELDGKK